MNTLRSGFTIVRIAILAAVAVASPRSADCAAFEIERIDGDTTNINAHGALALDSGGQPHVIYAYDVDSARYARKSGGAWSFDRIDFAFFSEGAHPSIEMDSADNPRVIYQANNIETPMYLRRSGSAWTVEFPPYGNQSGMFNSLELDTQDYPHFTDVSSGLTYMIRYHRRVSAGWIVETVDFINDIGVSGSSLALDASDAPHVTYNGPGLALRYARRAGGAWTIETIEAGGAGVWSPIAIDASGNPCVAYSTASGIRYARRASGAWTIESPFTSGPTGFGVLSLALDGQGEPHLTYSRGFEGDLYYARRESGAWIEETVIDNENYVGGANALVLDANDAPHIVFGDGTAADILYAHPPSVTGVGAPGARGRTARVKITPNPSRGGAVAIEGIDLDLVRSPGGGAIDALVVDASGRIVRRLRGGFGGGDSAALTWDGRDADGRIAPAGVYFVRLRCGNALGAEGRMTIVR